LQNKHGQACVNSYITFKTIS